MAYMKTRGGRKLDTFEAAVDNSPALPRTRLALANGDCDILKVVNSKGEAYGAPTPADGPIPNLAAKLRARFNPAGVAGGFGYVPAWYASTYTDGAPSLRFTYGGTVTSNGQESGLGRRNAVLSGSGSTATITSPAGTTGFKLFFTRRNSSADAVTVTVDGGAATPVAITGTGGGAMTSGFVHASGALSAGAHTIVVTQTGGTPYLEGIMFFAGDETSGVRVWDGCHQGYFTQSFVDNDAHAAKWQGVLPVIAPDLVIFGYPTNEHGTGLRTPAQYKQDLVNFIAMVRSKVAQCDLMLSIDDERGVAGITPVAPFSAYRAAAYEVVAEDTGGVGGKSGIALLDLSLGLPKRDDNALSMHHDSVHWNKRGNLYVAEREYTAIVGA